MILHVKAAVVKSRILVGPTCRGSHVLCVIEIDRMQVSTRFCAAITLPHRCQQ